MKALPWIILGVAVLGGGFAVYWFLIRKKPYGEKVMSDRAAARAYTSPGARQPVPKPTAPATPVARPFRQTVSKKAYTPKKKPKKKKKKKKKSFWGSIKGAVKKAGGGILKAGLKAIF